MNEKEIKDLEKLLRNAYLQLHLSVVYEDNFIENLGSVFSLRIYRDDILDKINHIRRRLGYIQ